MIFTTLPFAVAAGTAFTQYAAQPAPGEWELVSAYFTPSSAGAVAVHATNYVTITLKQGSTSLGALTTNSTGGAALVAGTPSAFSLSGGSALQFGQADPLVIDVAHGGTGGAANGTLACAWKKKQADAHYT